MRLKHYRGARVHSPFVYGVVRGALMPNAQRPVEEQIAALFEYLGVQELHSGEAVCVVSHRGNRRVRREIVARHDGTSFETRRFLCILMGERLPKQHFKF